MDGTVTEAELAALDAALPEQLRMAAGIMAGSREVGGLEPEGSAVGVDRRVWPWWRPWRLLRAWS